MLRRILQIRSCYLLLAVMVVACKQSTETNRPGASDQPGKILTSFSLSLSAPTIFELASITHQGDVVMEGDGEDTMVYQVTYSSGPCQPFMAFSDTLNGIVTQYQAGPDAWIDTTYAIVVLDTTNAFASLTFGKHHLFNNTTDVMKGSRTEYFKLDSIPILGGLRVTGSTTYALSGKVFYQHLRTLQDSTDEVDSTGTEFMSVFGRFYPPDSSEGSIALTISRR